MHACCRCDADLVPPVELAGLTRLQRCYLQRAGQREGDDGEVPALPGGPWLRSLRWLGANVDILARSLDALQQAAALEFVCVHDAHFHEQFSWGAPATASLFSWLASCAPLERLTFESWSPFSTSAFDSRHFASLLLQLSQQRPALQLHIVDDNSNDQQSMPVQLSWG